MGCSNHLSDEATEDWAGHLSGSIQSCDRRNHQWKLHVTSYDQANLISIAAVHAYYSFHMQFSPMISNYTVTWSWNIHDTHTHTHKKKTKTVLNSICNKQFPKCVWMNEWYSTKGCPKGCHVNHSILVLADHFKVPLQRNNFDLQQCLEEWTDMKFCVQRVRNELLLMQNVFWKNKFMLCQDHFPNLFMLIEIYLVIPCQTACCERGEFMYEQNNDWLEVHPWFVYCWDIDENITQWSLTWGI